LLGCGGQWEEGRAWGRSGCLEGLGPSPSSHTLGPGWLSYGSPNSSCLTQAVVPMRDVDRAHQAQARQVCVSGCPWGRKEPRDITGRSRWGEPAGWASPGHLQLQGLGSLGYGSLSPALRSPRCYSGPGPLSHYRGWGAGNLSPQEEVGLWPTHWKGSWTAGVTKQLLTGLPGTALGSLN
jgi:hypothetical protein